MRHLLWQNQTLCATYTYDIASSESFFKNQSPFFAYERLFGLSTIDRTLFKDRD